MPTNVSVIKGAVVVEGALTEPDRQRLVRLCATRSTVEVWRAQHTALALLLDLPGLADLSLVNVRVDDPGALPEISTLRRLFLNQARFRTGWGFLASLTQIEELHLLNVRGEVVLPDLRALDRLRMVRVWGCTGLTDVSGLAVAPHLEDVRLVDTGMTPAGLAPLLEKPSVRRLSSTFPRIKDDEHFRELLARHGKTADSEAS